MTLGFAYVVTVVLATIVVILSYVIASLYGKLESERSATARWQQYCSELAKEMPDAKIAKQNLNALIKDFQRRIEP